MMKMQIGKFIYLKISLAALVFLVSGCQSFIPAKFTEVGNNSDMFDAGHHCVKGGRDRGDMLPVTVYERMNKCIINGEWDGAVYLYSLAGSLTWYDAVQVDTQFARSMHSRLLKQSLDALNDTQRVSFWEHIKVVMSDDVKKLALCTDLVASGAPTYHPDYMLLSSSSGIDRKHPMTTAWKKAVNSYVGCESAKL